MAGIKLEWAQFGHFESFDVLRSENPMSINALPSPIVTSLPTMYHVDTSVVEGETYYYRVRAWRDGVGKLSDELIVVALEGDPHWENVVSLLSFENGLLDAAKPNIGWASFSLSPIVDGGRFGKGVNLNNDYQKMIRGAWRAEHYISNIYTIEVWVKFNEPAGKNMALIDCYSSDGTLSGFRFSILSCIIISNFNIFNST